MKPRKVCHMLVFLLLAWSEKFPSNYWNFFLLRTPTHLQELSVAEYRVSESYGIIGICTQHRVFLSCFCDFFLKFLHVVSMAVFQPTLVFLFVHFWFVIRMDEWFKWVSANGNVCSNSWQKVLITRFIIARLMIPHFRDVPQNRVYDLQKKRAIESIWYKKFIQ